MAIRLSFSVDDINTVILIYDQIQVARLDGSTDGTPATVPPYTTLSGVSGHPIDLSTGTTNYSLYDTDGVSTSWYMSRYINTGTSAYSGWSDPVLGEAGDLFYNPLFPPEIAYGTADERVIDRIRRLIGDPKGLRREYGEDATSSIHFDNKTYELDEKGWPVSVAMGGIQMNDSTDPTINGYRYLRFDQDISVTTYSGSIEYGVDIWYYVFRHSDREIMEAYDNQPPPPPLTTTTANSEVYMLATAIELLEGELWEDATEDGAAIRDEGSNYNPEPGLTVKQKMLAALRKKLADMVKALQMPYVGGVLID